jgi:DNA-binding Lrp family transcriptional regulator
MKFREAEKKE